MVVGAYRQNSSWYLDLSPPRDYTFSLPSSYQLKSINQNRGDKLQTPLHRFWMVLHFGNYWNSGEHERVE